MNLAKGTERGPIQSETWVRRVRREREGCAVCAVRVREGVRRLRREVDVNVKALSYDGNRRSRDTQGLIVTGYVNVSAPRAP